MIVERTAGEVSPRCHDEQANLLALNMVNDIVTGDKSLEEARACYAKEFLDYRRKEPTLYVESCVSGLAMGRLPTPIAPYCRKSISSVPPRRASPGRRGKPLRSTAGVSALVAADGRAKAPSVIPTFWLSRPLLNRRPAPSTHRDPSDAFPVPFGSAPGWWCIWVEATDSGIVPTAPR